ncbi:MAG: hypothetical protein WBM83_14985, partial [Flavobacteriaceae bacterium]
MRITKNVGILICILGLSNSIIAQKETSRDWTSFVQSISISTDKPIKFRVTAYAKNESDHENGQSGLWVRVDTKNGERGYFDNMGDRPITSKEWKKYIIEAEIDENSKTLNFGALCWNNGRFLFDNFEVLTQNSKGEFEKLDIKNGSFEITNNGNAKTNWIEGIQESNPVRIKEYTFSSSSDAIDGKKSLLITGDGVIEDTSDQIGPIKDFSPQIGTLVSMLDNLKGRVETQVAELSQKEIDYLLDEKANSIGALVMHLIATEVYFQSVTFDKKDVFKEKEGVEWEYAMSLGNEGQENIKGHEIGYYL